MLAQHGQSNRLAISSRRSEMEAYEPPMTPGGGKTTPNVFVVAWRRRWIVLACIVIALACGGVYCWKAVPVYASSSVIYVQPSVPKIIGDGLTEGVESADYLYTQCQLIQSTTIIAGAIDVPGVADADCLKGVENPIGFIKSRVSATPSRQGDLIIVSMESPTPQGAAVIVNGVVQAYIDYQTRMHQSTAMEIVGILQKNMDQHEAELKQAQNAMLNMERDNPDVVFQGTSDAGGGHSAVSQLSDELSDSQVRVMDLKIAMSAAIAAQNDPVTMRRILSEYGMRDLVPSDDPVAALAGEYSREKQTLDGMVDRLGPRNQTVQEQHRLVQRLRQELEDASKQQTAGLLVALQQSLQLSQTRVKQLQDAIATQRKQSMAMTSKQIEFQQLQQEVQRAERALDLLDSRIKDINPSEDVGTLTVTPLETAKPVLVPVRPNRVQAMAISLVAGLVVGVGLGMLRETFDQRLRSAEEASMALDLPMLGIVPHIQIDSRSSASRGQETASRPRSDVAEAFRTIRTALYFGAHNSRTVKTVLLTSPGVSDGKSTAASNLAIAVAQAGRRVLLIDADCRRPSQDKTFKLEGPLGLSSVLSGECQFEQAVRKSVMTRLDVLPCGPLPDHPAELLDSQIFADLLKTSAAEYDHIFIDSPPVLPVSDARIIGAFCDATILVLRAQQSTRRMAEHACQVLDSVGAKLLGLILNDVSGRQRGYQYAYAGYRSFNEGHGAANGKSNGHAARNTLAVTGELMDED